MSKELKMTKLGFALKPEMFDMNVDSSALYATNAIELYRRALIGENSSRSLFKQIYGIKDRVKLGSVDFTNVVKPGACDFDPSDSDIAQVTKEVCPIMVGTSFCVEDLETSFVSDQIGKGSANFSEPAAFMNFFYQTLSDVVADELETITWQGDVTQTTNYLGACDGLEIKLGATGPGTTMKAATASAVTSGNIIAKMIEARTAFTGSNKGVKNSADFAYMLSTNAFEAYLDAISDNKNSGLYFVEGLGEVTFQGKKVIHIEGASDNVIVAGQLSNFLFITDLLSDVQGWNVVDFMKTALNRRIGVRTDAKVSFDFLRPTEIWYHAI